MKKITIGFPWNFYYYKRNIVNKIQSAEYVKVIDIYKILSVPAYLINKVRFFKIDKLVNYYKFSFNDLGINKVDFLHFFNSVSFGSTPWIVTFETYIPRFSIQQKKKMVKGLNALASDNCKKIIAISKSALINQKIMLEHFPEYKEKIINKTIVLQPPQTLIVHHFEEKNIDLESELKFIFVGHDFFRKGGAEILQAFDYLKKEKQYNVKLTIISKLLYKDYMSKTTRETYNKAVNFISMNRQWINYYKELPNKKVLDLMKNHHIGVLPTWADTYGFSLLEMQASGCPVITTNVRSLPEINNNDIGWMIKVPLNKNQEIDLNNQRIEIHRKIITELIKIVEGIYSNRNVIKIKSEGAILNIRNNHSPEKFASSLKKIYLKI